MKNNKYNLLKLSDEDYALLCEEAMYFYEKTDDEYFEDAGINKTKDEFLAEMVFNRGNGSHGCSLKESVEDDMSWDVIEAFLHNIRTPHGYTIEGLILSTFITDERWDYWLAKHKEGGRLEDIKRRLEHDQFHGVNRTLYNSDIEYLQKLVNQYGGGIEK